MKMKKYSFKNEKRKRNLNKKGRKKLRDYNKKEKNKNIYLSPQLTLSFAEQKTQVHSINSFEESKHIQQNKEEKIVAD